MTITERPTEQREGQLGKTALRLILEANKHRPGVIVIQSAHIAKYSQESEISVSTLQDAFFAEPTNTSEIIRIATFNHREIEHIIGEMSVTRVKTNLTEMFDVAFQMRVLNREELDWIYNDLYETYKTTETRRDRRNKYREIIQQMIAAKQQNT